MLRRTISTAGRKIVVMFRAIKKRRERKREIAKLSAYIDGVYEGERKGAKTRQEEDEAYQIAHSICQWDENRLDYLRQEDLLLRLKNAPFEVPKDYWTDDGWDYRMVLTRKGEAWARNELKKVWRTDVEFWFKLFLPVLALVISIVALVRKR